MKGLEALKEIAIQSVEALIETQEPLRTQKINELLETKQFKCIKKELKALEIIKNALTLHVFETLEGKHFLEAIEDCNGISKDNYDLLKEILKWK